MKFLQAWDIINMENEKKKVMNNGKIMASGEKLQKTLINLGRRW